MNKIKSILFIATLIILGLLLVGCGSDEPQQEILWDAKPSVMVDDILYGDTGHSAVYRTDERPEKGGRVDGEITSTVESHQYPSENDQSNFGTGYPYRYGEEGTVEVFFDQTGKWKIFEAYEEE